MHTKDRDTAPKTTWNTEMSTLALTEIKVERIDEEEPPCNDSFPPNHLVSKEFVISYDNKFDVLKQVKKEIIEEEITNEIVFEFPPNDSDTKEHITYYGNKFNGLIKGKKDISEEEIPEPSYSSTNKPIFEYPPNQLNSKEHVTSYDNKVDVLKQIKKDISEEESPESSNSFTSKKTIGDTKILEPIIVKHEVPCEYNEYEELFLSVKVKEGDRKYQGRRKTERLNDQNKNTSVHYDTLVTSKQVSCKFCGKKFINSFNLLKHNIEHMKLDINTPDVIKKYESKHKRFNNNKSEKRPYNKRGEHKTKLLYYCKYCDKHYQYRSWHKHLETVHSEKKYKCGLCGKKFRCFGYVENHMKMVHIVQMYRKTVTGKMFKCWCGKEFRSQIYLDKHKKERHDMSGHTYTPINLSFL